MVLLPLARSQEVLERVTVTTTLLLVAERPGRDTTPSACGDTDKRIVTIDHIDIGQRDCFCDILLRMAQELCCWLSSSLSTLVYLRYQVLGGKASNPSVSNIAGSRVPTHSDTCHEVSAISRCMALFR